MTETDHIPAAARRDAQELPGAGAACRVAALTSHPIQYQAPLFRELARQPGIQLRVYFGSDNHFASAALDRDFGVPVAWDRPLLEGYDSRFLSQGRQGSGAASRARACVTLLRELVRQRYDAIVLTSYSDALSLAAYLGAWASGTRVLLRAESELLRKRRAWVRAAKRLLLPLLFRRTAAFLAIGTANRQFFGHYGVTAGATFDVPYCVDNDFFLSARAQLPPKAELKREQGLDPEQPAVVFSGKLIDRKRPLDLVAAHALLAERGIGAGLLLVGDGPLRGEIEQMIAARGLRNVRVTGFRNQTELPRCYACGDIFVLPSEFETWGLVVNEGMLFGMPAVVTDMTGCAQDLVEDGRTGFVYPTGDVGALAARLEQLLRDPAARDAMGRAAEERVRRLSYAACTRGILQALESAGRGPRNGAESRRG